MMLDEALKSLNVPTADFHVAKTVKDAERFAKKLGFPCVLKLVSKKVSHKTEAGGVVIARDLAQVREAAARFTKEGSVLVQEFCDGVEMFIGIKKDQTFGHVLLTGIGGIFVEVYKDVAFRVCPITKRDAESMLDELKGKALLAGVRGKKPVNRAALIDAMVKLSELPRKMPNIEELDVNPFIVGEKQGVAVDARFVLK
ncbi:ATP-grasp domain-containing protein [Candidatus Woesearchaeota archaeon]|nr:MAG: ATP-grasp domain-containing protein [Candidatus Woesearchaeota archaeon]